MRELSTHKGQEMGSILEYNARKDDCESVRRSSFREWDIDVAHSSSFTVGM